MHIIITITTIIIMIILLLLTIFYKGDGPCTLTCHDITTQEVNPCRADTWWTALLRNSQQVMHMTCFKTCSKCITWGVAEHGYKGLPDTMAVGDVMWTDISSKEQQVFLSQESLSLRSETVYELFCQETYQKQGGHPHGSIQQ